MTPQRPNNAVSCPCCHGYGGYHAPTQFAPAEYCDLCYGLGWVTAQRRAAYTAHRVYRAAQIAKHLRTIRNDPNAF